METEAEIHTLPSLYLLILCVYKGAVEIVAFFNPNIVHAPLFIPFPLFLKI